MVICSLECNSRNGMSSVFVQLEVGYLVQSRNKISTARAKDKLIDQMFLSSRGLNALEATESGRAWGGLSLCTRPVINGGGVTVPPPTTSHRYRGIIHQFNTATVSVIITPFINDLYGYELAQIRDLSVSISAGTFKIPSNLLEAWSGTLLSAQPYL